MKCQICSKKTDNIKTIKGKCKKCYHREYQRTYKRPDRIKMPAWHRNNWWTDKDCGYIELKNNNYERVGIAIVDKDDLLRCVETRKWHLSKTNKNVISTIGDGKAITLGRFILGGKDFDGEYVCHLDDDQLNNRKKNLCYDSYSKASDSEKSDCFYKIIDKNSTSHDWHPKKRVYAGGIRV